MSRTTVSSTLHPPANTQAQKPIQVTEPYLPPIEEYVGYLHGIWDRSHLTNNGPLVKEFEQLLQTHHGLTARVSCVANGALGLQVALKALGIGGEIIITPFSYVATASCPLWEGCTLRFADIDNRHLTLDPEAVEAAITPKTEAILATHVFGNACDVEALAQVAHRHGLALIYDAAHAFGVSYNGKSLLEWGDASMVSMHATKLFHSIEGGFVVATDPGVSEKIAWMRRFGHKGFEAFHGVGINAKMCEFHAAMGLCVFKHLDEILEKREMQSTAYDTALLESGAPASGIVWRNGVSRNYSYYPVIFDSEQELLACMQRLERESIYSRRYFYPSLDTVSELGGDGTCPISQDISKRILCLPLATSLNEDDIYRIASIAFDKRA